MTTLSSPTDAANSETFRTRTPLLQRDLFLCILDCFDPPGVIDSRFVVVRRALFSLARTCRAFSGPSLDRLWYRLDSLSPLVRCYAPREIDEERAKTPPTPAEWTIIRRHSHRVKEVRIDTSRSLSMLFLRATSLQPTLLLPNLKVLQWHPCVFPDYHPAYIPVIFVQRLLSSSLTCLDVVLGDPDDGSVQSFLANYPFICPNLKFILIDIGFKKVSHTTIRLLSQSITHYNHLEHLCISAPIDDTALAHVAILSKLKDVKLVLHSKKSNLHQFRLPLHAIPFRNVGAFCLNVWDVSFVTNLLRPQDQMFGSFALHHCSIPTPCAVSSLFTALASPQRSRSLQSIYIIADNNIEDRPSAMELDESTVRAHLPYDTFRPLSSLGHLHKLVVDVGRWLSIDDDELLSLIHNWPFLRVLELNCEHHIDTHPWRSAKYVTLDGLLSLLECCPQLRELSLPVDAREAPTRSSDVVCHPHLMELYFPESPISDVNQVQDFLIRHFPSVIQAVSSFHLESEDGDNEVERYRSLWASVNCHIEDIHYPSEDA